uniref:hypothetical protein n=1 Tax=uncultured Altererythrobacter sp. TaxID=500840 RepID=UPI0026241C24|nr:hypothetical protein [uncultured Altererythrobacter sp.]
MGLARLNSVEGAIAAVATVAGVLLQYFAIPTIIDIPENISPMYQYLTTGVLIILIFVGLLLLDAVAAWSAIKQAVLVLTMLAIGVGAAVSFSNQIDRHSFAVTCRNENEAIVLAPASPSDELKSEMVIAGDLTRGWCNHPRKTLFRALVKQEAVPDATEAGLKLLLAQLLLACGLLFGVLLVLSKEPGAPEPADKEPSDPPQDDPGNGATDN